MAAIQRLILSQKPLSGFIQVKGYFSIIPVHQWVNLTEEKSFFRHADWNADRFGPPYPLYIEIEHPGEMGHEWRHQALLKLERYERLARLLIIGLKSPAHQSHDEHWVSFFKVNAEDVDISYGLSSPGFSVVGEASLSRFLEEGGLPATPFITSDGADYYDALHTSNLLNFPNNLEMSMAKYESLRPKLKKSFDRAAFLFHQGEFLQERQFAPLTSFASAVECLLSKKSEKCSCCGQEKYGISRRFNEFIEKFAPVSDGIRPLQSKMYQNRSKETHGISIPDIDKQGLFKSFDSIRYMFPLVVRKALVNWLIQSDHQEA